MAMPPPMHANAPGWKANVLHLHLALGTERLPQHGMQDQLPTCHRRFLHHERIECTTRRRDRKAGLPKNFARAPKHWPCTTDLEVGLRRGLYRLAIPARVERSGPNRLYLCNALRQKARRFVIQRHSHTHSAQLVRRSERAVRLELFLLHHPENHLIAVELCYHPGSRARPKSLPMQTGEHFLLLHDL